MTGSMPSLKLVYFDARSKGEVIRLCMHVGSIPFEDYRVVRSTEWPSLKPQTPFGQLPLLTIDNSTTIAQSNAILRYVGTLAGLYPSTDLLNAALVDQIVLQITDIRNLHNATKKDPDPVRVVATRETLATTCYPAMFGYLDKTIAQHSAGIWAVGHTLTIADLMIYANVSFIKDGQWAGIPADLVDAYPKGCNSL
ncbi:hypothetical protein BDEG_22295 [Batrachochytrium dendrobatidis JEL423]|uniref:GST N-terminal domain-containing protein n=1 Tax=Batrachochytrium dendrobatidis (strain JEL423) TaxID=403673 RepID=A0A177WG53_BATDL|nr:hypothetical protein BDEG_22295 [Batrachochytrium dendrobatidis JEL423]